MRSKRAAGKVASAPRPPEHDAVHRFVGNVVESLAAEGQVAVERILVDGRAIAAAIILRSGRFAWFWKIAYDERFARFSPGVDA